MKLCEVGMLGVSLTDWREQVRGLLSRKASEPGALAGTSPGDGVAELPLDDIKSAVKTFRDEQWQLGPKSAFDFLNLVFPDRRHDEVVFGIYLLTLFKRQLPSATWTSLEGWLSHVDHWVVCDQLAINLAGRLVAEDKTRFKILHTWVQSESEWRRRFAMVTACVVHTKQGCRSKGLLKLAESLMNDSSNHVQTAVAKAVRQVASVDEAQALAFLKKWKGRCHHEIFREASLRLSADAKMALLKAKSHG